MYRVISYVNFTIVWDLIHRDCDLAWSAVNSHFILGIMGFTSMLWLRAYVMVSSSILCAVAEPLSFFI